MLRLPTLLLAFLLAAVLAAAPAADAKVNVAIGLGDQSHTMFTNKFFKPLKVKRVRYVIRWDAIDHPLVLAGADAYVAAAQAAGANVLMHITTNDYRIHKARLPSVGNYTKHVRALVERYRPQGVTEWGVFNEANHGSEPTYKNARRAAQFFSSLRSMCRGCTIVALDLLDQVRSADYVNRFYRALPARERRYADVVGIHNYAETNRGSTGRTDAIIRAVRRYNRSAKFWFTETGGIVKSWSFRCDTRRAAVSLERMFAMARHHRATVTRLYAYSFFGERPNCALRDYGIVTWNGWKRRGYDVFARQSRGFAAERELQCGAHTPLGTTGFDVVDTAGVVASRGPGGLVKHRDNHTCGLSRVRPPGLAPS